MQSPIINGTNLKENLQVLWLQDWLSVIRNFSLLTRQYDKT